MTTLTFDRPTMQKYANYYSIRQSLSLQSSSIAMMLIFVNPLHFRNYLLIIGIMVATSILSAILLATYFFPIRWLAIAFTSLQTVVMLLAGVITIWLFNQFEWKILALIGMLGFFLSALNN